MSEKIQVNIKIDKDVFRDFQILLLTKHGKLKGVQSEAVEDAIRHWTEKEVINANTDI